MATTFMGPYCAMLLAQMGAEVIKVERPGGDIARLISDRRGHKMGPPFLNVNRGKRSVLLDLRQDEDYRAMLSLLATADVFVSNLRPAKLVALRLDYERLSKVNPGLIVASLYGFGESGPYAGKAAYDDIIQGGSGLASLQADPEPAYVKSGLVDKTVGLMGACAISAALVERSASGHGQALDVPMFESMVAMNAVDQMGGLVFDPQDGEAGYPRMSSPYRKPYATKDGYISTMVYTDRQWHAFFELIERPELIDDPRFRTLAERTENTDELYSLLEDTLRERSTDEWLAEFDKRDIPCLPVNSLTDLIDDEQCRATGVFEQVDHPQEGGLRQPGLPWAYSRTPLSKASPAPTLGEHTEEIKNSLR